ncbi:hypothetical protein ACWKWO_14525 [Schumannella luteola]
MTIDLTTFAVSTGAEFERLKLDVVTAVSLGGGLVTLPLSEGMLSHSILVTPNHRIEFTEREHDGWDPGEDAFPEL